MRYHGSFCILVGAAVLALPIRSEAGQPTVATPTAEVEGFDACVEAGLVFGVNNRNDYVLAPVYAGGVIANNAPVALGRHELRRAWTFDTFALPFLSGPEDLMVGGLLGRRFEFSKPGGACSLFFEARGGVGFVDSSGEPDAQGQDFAFHATLLLGGRWRMGESWSLRAGVLYTHISNGGLSEPERPNIGLDSLGPFVGVTAKF